MIAIILIYTIYIIVYNVGMTLLAHLFGVRVEKFYIWMDTGFRIFKFKVKHTEYGLGWLPIGGYVRFAGMLPDKDEEPAPYQFRAVSTLKQVLIMAAGPVVCLIAGIVFYTVDSGKLSESFVITTLSVFFVILIAGLLFRYLSNSLRKNIENRSGGGSQVLVCYVFYAFIFLLICFYIHEQTPFFNTFVAIIRGEIDFSNFTVHQGNFKHICAFVGVGLFIMNMIPLGGLNGFKIVSSLYEHLTGCEMPEQVAIIIGLIGIPFSITMYGLLLYHYFF